MIMNIFQFGQVKFFSLSKPDCLNQEEFYLTQLVYSSKPPHVLQMHD